MNNRFDLWMRNVSDEFKKMSNDEIRSHLRETAFPCACLMEHWLGDFNIGTMIRNSNAFNVSEVFYVGKKKFDPRGAVGAHHYAQIQRLKDLDEVKTLKERYVFVCLDNIAGAVPMETFEWPSNSLIIFGEEGEGLTEEMLDLADHIVGITQFGSVRSLNVGSSSAIAFYDYCKKYNKNLV